MRGVLVAVWARVSALILAGCGTTGVENAALANQPIAAGKARVVPAKTHTR